MKLIDFIVSLVDNVFKAIEIIKYYIFDCNIKFIFCLNDGEQ